jgi:hypothetical protein
MTVDHSECVPCLNCAMLLVQMYIKDHYCRFWKRVGTKYIVATTVEGNVIVPSKLSTFFQLQSEVIALVFPISPSFQGNFYKYIAKLVLVLNMHGIYILLNID